MNRNKYRWLVISLLIGCVFSYVSGCGGSSSGVDGDITEEENNDRVGQKIIRCAQPEVPQETIDSINAMLANARVSTPALRTARDSGSVTIPTIVHVISSGSSVDQGNVTDQQIAEQIAVLNTGFTGGQGGNPTAFQFSLTQITRTVNPSWANMLFGSREEREAKTALRQGDQSVLNMYLTAPQDGTLGWATFPWEYNSDPLLDGVVVQFQSLPAGALAPYNEGDTAVHEVGHWLGLFHTFQGGCSATNDDVADTPAESRPAFSCPVGRNSCPGDAEADPVSNFMNYSDDFCLTEFSPVQGQRMDNMSLVFRNL